MVGVVTPRSAPMTETTEPRAVVSWEGPDQPIVLTLYGPAGEVAVPLIGGKKR